VWERLYLHFADDPDMENGMIDSTIVRAHPCPQGHKKTVVKQTRRWDVVKVDLAPRSMSQLTAWAIHCGCG